MTQAGSSRAAKLRTRKHAAAVSQKEKERDIATGSLSQNEYWAKHVRSEQDVVTFYQLYYPDYPDILCKSIAARIAGIIEKSRRGDPLTSDDIGYVTRSKAVKEQYWDPQEEIKEQEKHAKVQMTMNKLE